MSLMTAILTTMVVGSMGDISVAQSAFPIDQPCQEVAVELLGPGPSLKNGKYVKVENVGGETARTGKIMTVTRTLECVPRPEGV